MNLELWSSQIINKVCNEHSSFIFLAQLKIPRPSCEHKKHGKLFILMKLGVCGGGVEERNPKDSRIFPGRGKMWLIDKSVLYIETRKCS